MTFPCYTNLTRHRTFNAGALVGVAISCHHWILHQLVRDGAAEILRVRHQPLHLKKMLLENWFLAKLEFPGGFGVFVVVSSCEECQSVAANRAFWVNQPGVTGKKGIVLFLFSSATLSYAIFAIPNLTLKKTQPNGFKCKVTSNPRPCALSPLWSLLSLSFQSGAVKVSTFMFQLKICLKDSESVNLWFCSWCLVFLDSKVRKANFLIRTVRYSSEGFPAHSSRAAWRVGTVTFQKNPLPFFIIYHSQMLNVLVYLPTFGLKLW